jgi:hypothetical protein
MFLFLFIEQVAFDFGFDAPLRAARHVFFAANCSHARELSLGVNQESRRVVVQKQ